MREIFIDVVNGSDSTIKVTQNDNLTGSYKLIITENSRRLDLTDKNIKFAFVKSDNHLGDIIEDLRVTNATQGEIDFPITNRITKVDGLYSCGIAIYNSTGYLEHTGTFNLYVRENLFEKVSGELLENSAYKELISLLDKATNLNAELNPLVTNGTALKTSLENDINQANNLKNNLETNTNRATTINDTLVKNTATAEEKNTTLNNSLEETKKYINGLDGSQNIPQIRIDLDTLQNGLKSNQELAYEGTNLKCENTFDGRIEDIVLEGMTYQNLIDVKEIQSGNSVVKGVISLVANGTWSRKVKFDTSMLKPNTPYTIIVSNTINTFTEGNNGVAVQLYGNLFNIPTPIKYSPQEITTKTVVVSTVSDLNGKLFHIEPTNVLNGEWKGTVLILEGDYTQPNSYIPSYFEGIKSVGEAEENKVNILSNGKNLVDFFMFKESSSTKIQINSDNIILEGNRQFANMSADLSSLKLVEGKTYYASAEVENIIGNQVYYDIWINGKSTSKLNFIYKKGDEVKLYIFANKDVFPSKSIIRKIMVSEGNGKYEPYKSDKRELKLPFEGGLKGLPNGAKDLIYNKDDGCYVRQKIGRILLNYNGNWFRYSNQDTENIMCFYSYGIENLTISSKLLCNRFKNIPYWNYNGETIAVDKISPSCRFFIKINKNKLETQDVAGFKKWLQSNPITVYYELAEPVETKISDTKLSLDTYNALTYVFSNNAISPNIKLKVASNLGSIIQQNAKSINDIYKLIDEVLIPQIATNTADIAVLKLK